MHNQEVHTISKRRGKTWKYIIKRRKKNTFFHMIYPKSNVRNILNFIARLKKSTFQ